MDLPVEWDGPGKVLLGNLSMSQMMGLMIMAGGRISSGSESLVEA